MNIIKKSFYGLFGSHFRIVSYKTAQSTAYVALPSIKKPRWILSLDPVSIKHAPQIVRPSSLLSKLFVHLVYVLIRAKMSFLLPRVHVEVDDFHRCQGNIYIGAKGIYQKLTVQKIQNEVVSFVKIAITEAAIARIMTEADCLDKLGLYFSRNEMYPQIIGRGSDYIEVSGSPKGVSSWSASLNYSHMVPLTELLRSSREIILFETGDITGSFSFPPQNVLEKSIFKLIEKRVSRLDAFLLDRKIVVCFSHGDYSPWNVVYGNSNQVFVFDWEMADIRPAGWDLFNFILHSEVLVFKSEISFANILIKYDEYIAPYFNAANIPKIQIPIYLLLYVMQMLSMYSIQLRENRTHNMDFEDSLSVIIWRLAQIIASEADNDFC